MGLPQKQIETIASLIGRMKGLGILASPQTPIDGPVVTAYPFILPDNLPISKLLAREEDLALAVGAPSVDIRRVEDKVVIFIPNKDRRVVNFLECLTWYLKDEKVKDASLPMMLGQDFRGKMSFLDIATLPHILIAGSTGSGKSVLESSIIASLATLKSPKELQIYLVDTKRVDLTLFETLPHIQATVKRISDWYPVYNRIFNEVQDRLRQLEGAGVRNIREYNLLGIKEMPYILIVIDELADLIEHDKAFREDNENHEEPKVIDAIKRLIQICRATGVHIIACTQRTSVDVISGVVKANFPARISLRLPTAIDSRTILGTIGAENLLGKGDMLIKHPDKDEPERFHGPYVRLEDIAAVLRDRDNIKEMIQSMV